MRNNELFLSNVQPKELPRYAYHTWYKLLQETPLPPLPYNDRVAQKTRSHNYKARKRSSSGKHTFKEIEDLLILQDYLCYYCGNPFFNYHIEHKIPLSRGGSNDISNIVLSCLDCNRRKHTKTDKEFFVFLKNNHI